MAITHFLPTRSNAWSNGRKNAAELSSSLSRCVSTISSEMPLRNSSSITRSTFVSLSVQSDDMLSTLSRVQISLDKVNGVFACEFLRLWYWFRSSSIIPSTLLRKRIFYFRCGFWYVLPRAPSDVKPRSYNSQYRILNRRRKSNTSTNDQFRTGLTLVIGGQPGVGSCTTEPAVGSVWRTPRRQNLMCVSSQKF